MGAEMWPVNAEFHCSIYKCWLYVSATN